MSELSLSGKSKECRPPFDKIALVFIVDGMWSEGKLIDVHDRSGG